MGSLVNTISGVEFKTNILRVDVRSFEASVCVVLPLRRRLLGRDRDLVVSLRPFGT